MLDNEVATYAGKVSSVSFGLGKASLWTTSVVLETKQKFFDAQFTLCDCSMGMLLSVGNQRFVVKQIDFSSRVYVQQALNLL